jgi:hypothetical protein
VKRRITIWTALGFLVAYGWTLYALATAPVDDVGLILVERGIRVLAYITCPTVSLGVMFYWVMPLNAATYALLGLVVESLRRRSIPRQARPL